MQQMAVVAPVLVATAIITVGPFTLAVDMVVVVLAYWVKALMVQLQAARTHLVQVVAEVVAVQELLVPSVAVYTVAVAVVLIAIIRQTYNKEAVVPLGSSGEQVVHSQTLIQETYKF
jgi:hypothetical protein